MNRASSPIRRRISLRHIVRSWPLRRADRVLRAGARPAARRRSGIGQAVSEIAKRPRRARHAARLRARARACTFVTDTLVTGVRPSGASVDRRRVRETTDRSRCGRSRDRRFVGAKHGQRRARVFRSPNSFGHVVHPTYAALTPLVGTAGHYRSAVRASVGRLASRHDHRASPRPRGRGDRRISLHASRIQRAVGARRVAHRGPIARRRQIARRDHGPMDAVERDASGKPHSIRADRERCSPRSAPRCRIEWPRRSSAQAEVDASRPWRNSIERSACV